MLANLTAAKIAEIAFGGVIQGAVGKVTEMGVGKLLKELQNKIRRKLQGNPEAVKAIVAVEQGSQSELTEVTRYLDAFMTLEPGFAQEVRTLAQQIQVQINNTQDNSSRTQTFQNQEKLYYTEQATATDMQIGDRLNSD
ncbi:MAG: hypothetical protein QNJ47_17875 [Nostocaceae cyanobacterium]|nr:hypothetical protein [Nostocaceae cyanobacterium]